MVASLIYYCNFCKDIKTNKFKFNPSDTCVTNQGVNGLQHSILYHVDDCKLSHKDAKVNEILIGVIHEEYKSIFEYEYGEMEVNHVNVHNYLGMKPDYTTVGKVNINMLDYIDELINAFNKADTTGGSTKLSTALAVLLKVDKYCEKLNDKHDVEFHNIVEKILIVTKSANPDTCAVI